MKVLERKEWQDSKSKQITWTDELIKNEIERNKTKEKREVEEVESEDDDDVDTEGPDGSDTSRAITIMRR